MQQRIIIIRDNNMSTCYKCNAILTTTRDKMNLKSSMCDKCNDLEDILDNDNLAPDRDLSFLNRDGKTQPMFDEGWND